MAAIKKFTVAYRGIRIKVRVMPTVADVHHAHQRDYKREIGKTVFAFFAPCAGAKHVGTIVLPSAGILAELIPHEVAHAVLFKLRSVKTHDDEFFATAVGRLSASIAKKMGCAS